MTYQLIEPVYDLKKNKGERKEICRRGVKVKKVWESTPAVIVQTLAGKIFVTNVNNLKEI